MSNYTHTADRTPNIAVMAVALGAAVVVWKVRSE